ncbi:DUF3320 domain-containing protein [Mucilaginibacter sp. CAU 1740]|uniref:DUF3320 domain-containing protein n=1 Tax=Mucilaginibacter sp. CAU 1740 TaxID=3140365 RepID=UPI00325BEDD6
MTNHTLSKSAIEISYNPVLNFALQQNYVPAIREIIIKNNSEADWHDVKIEITSEPDFATKWQGTIEVLQVGESYQLKPSINISTRFLSELTEKISGNYLITITADNEVIFQENYPVSVLAFDQWGGIGLLPEMLTAFSTPNHPEVAKILRSAAAILERWTGNPSFDEYQSRNPNRVRKQMAAIYEAIAQMQLIYCSVPASFEESGQRIRLVDTIFSQRLANCLDLSLLYSACLEAIGIHPLLIIVKGHAFVGGWLINESFADAVNDDPSLISKRMADGINEIVVVEATCMNAGHQNSFDDAVRSAEQKMLNTADFILFIDVKRARFSSIRPLPLRLATANGWELVEAPKSDRDNLLPEDITVGGRLINVDKIDVSKQQLWERKLLDLTLRNSLLNIRITKSVIQLITINVGKLEDALADGQEFQVLAKPSDWDNPIRDTGVYQALHQSDPIADLVKHELTQKRVRTYLSENDLSYSLTSLYRSSRVSIEENGANTLYIALGLLKWYETEASERPRYAPILLLPVEIIRKSAQKGYIIRGREEETMMNITLLEMLRQDFGLAIGGLETLPKDESGVDVKAIFNTIRQAVMSKSRWDIEEQALLGNFSFSKFILWNDIHNNAEKLCRNKVVASLVSGRLEWQPEENAAVEAITDLQLHPASIALPISTDSSQLQAILSSGQGKSFVLHGPPGTGKSQTITNIIANALYAGKRVLFVAAKKAALDVVENRLEAIGIGDFCLELHSNKSKKTAVLEQLKAATEIAHRNAPADFAAEAQRLFDLRNELNTYVTALHVRYPFGYSLFDLFTAYSLIPGTSEVYFAPAVFEQLTTTHLTNWQDLAEEMQVAGLQTGSPAGHALSAINLQQYSAQLKQQAQLLIETLVTRLRQLADNTDVVSDILKIGGLVKSPEQEQALITMVSLVLKLTDVPSSILKTESFEQTLAQVTGLAAHGIVRDGLRAELSASFQKGILSFPAANTLTEWHIVDKKWFLPRWLGQRKIQKNLASLSLAGSVEKDQIPDLLNKVIAYQEEEEIINKASYLPPLIGYLWNNGEVKWQQVKDDCELLIRINQAAAQITGIGKLSSWRTELSAEFYEGSAAYINQHKKLFDDYLRNYQLVNDSMTELSNLLGIDFNNIIKSNPDWKLAVDNAAEGWLSHLHQLPDWYNWLNVKTRALSAGLQPLVNAYEGGKIADNKVVQHFQKGFYKSAADFILEKNPQLATFNSTIFEDKIKRFRAISQRFETLTRQELYARLAAKIPSFTQEASQSSEIGFLQRTIRNNGRAMSIRKIFDTIPNLLPRLTPCMLMSPISVAQYFDTESEKFDLVIFDEASQMPTCEAIGAIARGTNVIIVGDPKQMPPTSFFSTNNIDEENIEKEDLESILDDCLALSMPSQHLLWHYRSKHESLIAFSNAKYYDNKLLTFPSTDDITSKVQFVPVNGFYDKGKTRTNHAEAKAIVDEVVRRLSDPQLAKRSMGIVTFSAVQQLLIDDLLTEVFSLRPDLEKIALECPEPVFIKNLENVQGDERDVIMFSICYGPDGFGKQTLNFGPINREGGWRRLNVAVSRARYEMKVFSTLRADQIDLSRTSSEGVAGLKAFLAYAEKGKIALPIRTSHKADNGPSFENLIADEIRKKGYEVHTQIGCSDYKIDLGIVDRDNPERYILGVLTDGKNYYNAKTSRDREIVQVDVLSQLGWNIHKIWSAEWWEKQDKVLNGLFEAIEHAEEHKNDKPVHSEPDLVVNPVREERIASQYVNVPPVPRPPVSSKAIPYEIYPVEIQLTTSADDFLFPQNLGKVKAQIFNVLNTESPISKNLLSKRVLAAWGISRQGARVAAHFDAIYRQMNIRQESSAYNTFFWKNGQEPGQYSIFRVAGNESQKRDAEDLPPEEIANGVLEILHNQIGLSKNDLVRETAKLFGYARIGSNVETAMLAGIDKALEKGEAKLENDRVTLRA